MTNRFDIIRTNLEGLVVLQRKPMGDARGYLERIYCSNDLASVLNGRKIAQTNHTFNQQAGTVRGLHFQYPPHAECKIVSCLYGSVYDVAVDLRRNSPTFLHWHGEVLSADNHRTMVIPEGFAHGFQALADASGLLYMTTAAYEHAAEDGLHVADQRLNIRWPLPIANLSERDRTQRYLTDAFVGIEL